LVWIRKDTKFVMVFMNMALLLYLLIKYYE